MWMSPVWQVCGEGKRERPNTCTNWKKIFRWEEESLLKKQTFSPQAFRVRPLARGIFSFTLFWWFIQTSERHWDEVALQRGIAFYVITCIYQDNIWGANIPPTNHLWLRCWPFAVFNYKHLCVNVTCAFFKKIFIAAHLDAFKHKPLAGTYSSKCTKCSLS